MVIVGGRCGTIKAMTMGTPRWRGFEIDDDEDGRIRSVIEANGTVRHLNENARLVSTDFADEDGITYTRDESGRAVSATFSDGHLEFYDERGRRIRSIRDGRANKVITTTWGVDEFGAVRYTNRNEQGEVVAARYLEDDPGVEDHEYDVDDFPNLSGELEWTEEDYDVIYQGEPDKVFEDETDIGEVVRRQVIENGKLLRTPAPDKVVRRRVFEDGELVRTYVFDDEGRLVSRTDVHDGFIITIGDYTHTETDMELPNGTAYTRSFLASDGPISVRTPDGTVWIWDHPAFFLVELGMYEFALTLDDREQRFVVELLQTDPAIASYQIDVGGSVIDVPVLSAVRQFKKDTAPIEAYLRTVLDAFTN